MKNQNPLIDEFLRLYSQSEKSTRGTRGYDEKTYVETKLDAKLIPTIFVQKTKLVILSGNAGDGKTAFIQRVEAYAQANGAQAFLDRRRQDYIQTRLGVLRRIAIACGLT